MKQACILNVDDREVNRYIRSQILRAAGYKTIEATTGREALEKAVFERPDLVLLDVHLPDISGLEVCRLIKSDHRTSSVMVLQLSASAVEFTDAIRGLDQGADDYMIEPVEPELLLAKVRSILRLRAAEQSLRQTNEDLKQFAFAVSHDLQEPLRTLASYAQLLDRRYREQLDSTADYYLSSIIDGAIRMSQLISDLLIYARLSAEIDVAPELVNLDDVVQHVLELNEPLIAETAADVTCDSLPCIEGHRARITQVFTNLVSNALKYRRPGVPPKVAITVRRQGSDWLFAVSDNGVGFDQAHAESIFGVFRRLHGREVPGSGIGLATCKSVVERSGGRIWAESQQGQGSTFLFTWPVAAVKAEGSAGVSG